MRIIEDHSRTRRIAFIPNPDSRIVSFMLALPGGSARDPDGKAGAGALCAETLFRGAADKDVDHLAAAIDDIGLRHAANVRHEYLVIEGDVMPEFFQPALELIVNVIRTATFPESEIASARTIQLQAISQRNELPGARLQNELGRRLWGVLGQDPTGDADTVSSLTRADAVDVLDSARRCHGRLFAASGGMDPDAAFHIMQDAEAALPEPDRPDPAPAPIPDNPGAQHIDFDSEQVHLGIAYTASPPRHDDHIPEQLAVGILSEGFSSRLFTEVREKRGLVYGVGAAKRSRRNHGAVIITASTSTQRARLTADVLDAELFRLGGDLTQDELDKAKRQFRARIARRNESSSGRASLAMADMIAGRDIVTPAQREAEILAPDLKTVCRVWNAILSRPPVRVSVGKTPVFDASPRSSIQ